jgi:homoserine dehydrogenase
VPHEHPLARVSGSFNAVMLRGREIREITLQGPGAGGAETATAIIGDLLSVLGPRPAGEVGTAFRELPLEPPGRARSPLYVHLEVTDRPGVLARIAARFGDRGISLGAMIQRPRPGDISSLVFLTHPASEENARSAVDEIATLDFCHGQPRVLRVLAA